MQNLLEANHPILWLFYPISALWAFVVFWKNWMYDRAFISPKAVMRPVVSIGNIVAGGTGKTPLTLLLASHFSHKKVAVLSRGISLQGSLLDEPELLRQRCPTLQVYLGKKRRQSALQAVEQSVDLLIMDDGLQHRKLFRDMDIVLISASKPFSNGRYLPSGYLRDSPKRLKEATLICVNPISSEEELVEWQKTYPLTAPLVGVRLTVNRIVPDESLRDVPVALFCGIAKPNAFRKVIKDLGAILIDEWILTDHERPILADLQGFALRAKALGAQRLVCTEKDRVKLPIDLQLPLPLAYPEMELQITAGHRNWQNLVDKIEQKIDNCRTYGY